MDYLSQLLDYVRQLIGNVQIYNSQSNNNDSNPYHIISLRDIAYTIEQGELLLGNYGAVQ